jgi:hypothetical protein
MKLNKRSFKKSERPESIETLVEQYASAAREAALRWRSVLFDLSAPTIPILEEMLGELYEELHKKSLRRKFGLGPGEVDIAQWANLWGIYLGEALRTQLGGTWITGHEEAPTLLAVELPDGTVIFPTARVFRRLSDGAAESVVDYYEMVLREARVGS